LKGGSGCSTRSRAVESRGSSGPRGWLPNKGNLSKGKGILGKEEERIKCMCGGGKVIGDRRLCRFNLSVRDIFQLAKEEKRKPRKGTRRGENGQEGAPRATYLSLIGQTGSRAATGKRSFSRRKQEGRLPALPAWRRGFTEKQRGKK